jgi:GT2 family glycosyltransferase
MKLIAVLVPVYNRIEITKRGLADLYRELDKYEPSENKEYTYKVIVIDDGSTDGTSVWIKRNYPDVVLLQGDGNLWWSGGINEGAQYAINKLDASFVLLWNNDIIPSPNYFENLVELVRKDEDRIIGSYIYDNKNKQVWSKGGRFNIFTGKRSMMPEKLKKSKYVYSWLPGMGSLIPVEVVLKLNYWDRKNFPQYYGDLDFTLKASRTGIEIVTSENLKIYNRTEFSSYKGDSVKSFFKSFSLINSRYNIRKSILFYRRHCISFLWIFAFLRMYMIYFLQTFVVKRR